MAEPVFDVEQHRKLAGHDHGPRNISAIYTGISLFPVIINITLLDNREISGIFYRDKGKRHGVID